eukprot:scaffold3505_cov170-Amphora_coffeaeformis.AAC.13
MAANNYSFLSIAIFGTLFLSSIMGKARGDPPKRFLQDFGYSSSSWSFDLLCQRLDRMPDFLCECVSQIPFRSIECQSTEICSLWVPDTCGQFLFQVNYMGPDISQLQSCVSYTQRQLQSPNDKYSYRDGCFTLDYEGDDTPTSCRLSFLSANDNAGGGELQDCESCSLCADGTAIQASCDEIQPLATSTGCVSIHLDGFFPGFRPGDHAEDDGTTTAGSAAQQQPVVLTHVVGIMVIWIVIFNDSLLYS